MRYAKSSYAVAWEIHREHSVSLSIPTCADICYKMLRVTGTELNSSQQHIEVSDARQTRDDKDMRLLLSFLEDRKPFARQVWCLMGRARQ